MRTIKHYTSNYIADAGQVIASIIATPIDNTIRFEHTISFKAARSGVVFNQNKIITLNTLEWTQTPSGSNIVEDFIEKEGLNILKADVFFIANRLLNFNGNFNGDFNITLKERNN